VGSMAAHAPHAGRQPRPLSASGRLLARARAEREAVHVLFNGFEPIRAE
jgi:hypothetical protein